MFSLFRRKPATDTMSLSEQSVLDSLKQFIDPNTGKDYNTQIPRRLLKLSTDYRLPGGRWRRCGAGQSPGGQAQGAARAHRGGGR